ncbi:MAG TPA: hypothetical protein VER33_14415 [Polyangiaceae bacterium]|nr:hypothetical protein [Polyangiaceae bacterium]
MFKSHAQSAGSARSWRRPSRIRPHLLAGLATLCFVLGICPTAGAYPWLLRHGYTNCSACHVDPSGSGVLTEYGRAVAEEVLRTRYPGEGAADGDGSAPVSRFLWGAVPLPASLMLGGDLRLLHLRQKVESAPALSRNLLMQADVEGALQIRQFVASASLGYAHEGSLGATLTRAPEHNLVSRTHWAGVTLADGAWMLRGGRMNLPFGLRVVEHTLWARRYTSTDINDKQQHGLSVAFLGQRLRSELMLIAGNFAIRPDVYRERGYSAYIDWLPVEKLSLGVSSLITHRDLHPSYLRPTWKHAHGVFARWATNWEPLVLMTELNYSLESPKYDQRREGLVGFLQADLEAAPGVHLMATAEAHTVGVDGPPASWGTWLSYAWFFAPHADLRVDMIYQSLGSSYGRLEAITLLLQTHLYL